MVSRPGRGGRRRCVQLLVYRSTTLDGETTRHTGLAVLAKRYAVIPYHRTRSDAEALALEVLYDAGVPLPHVNIEIGGEEADLVWLEARVIIEIDGPQFHRFRDEDARKAGISRKRGFEVRRISSDAIYDAPGELIALALRPRS